MKLRHSEAGFSAVELVIVVLILGVLAVVGFRVMNANAKTTLSSTSSQTSSAKTATVAAPAVSKASDLDAAQQSLDQNDPTTSNSTDTSQLDADLSGLN